MLQFGVKNPPKKILGVFHVLHRSQVQKKGHFSQFHSKKCNYLQPFLWQQSLQNIFISDINLYGTLEQLSSFMIIFIVRLKEYSSWNSGKTETHFQREIQSLETVGL